MAGVLLWLLGVPLSVIILLYLLFWRRDDCISDRADEIRARDGAIVCQPSAIYRRRSNLDERRQRGYAGPPSDQVAGRFRLLVANPHAGAVMLIRTAAPRKIFVS